MVFAIDTLDKETWSNKTGDPHWRARRHEQWMDYITTEMVPFIRDKANQANGWTGYPGILAFGCSLGATHAANLYFRRPDLFDGLLALSGIYNADYGFDGYMDEVVYQNSPVHYLSNLPEDHPYIPRLHPLDGGYPLPEGYPHLGGLLGSGLRPRLALVVQAGTVFCPLAAGRGARLLTLRHIR